MTAYKTSLEDRYDRDKTMSTYICMYIILN